jgi:hypothetical protein
MEAIIVFGVAALLMIWSLVTLVRNSKVYAYRGELIDKMYDAADDDINRGRSYKWRQEVYQSVSYNEMVYKFWKPIDSFYPDKSFIEIGQK